MSYGYPDGCTQAMHDRAFNPTHDDNDRQNAAEELAEGDFDKWLRGQQRMSKQQHSRQRAERRAAPKPARIPSGDRPMYSSDEGHVSA